MLAEAFSMLRTNRRASNEVLPEDRQTTTPKRAVGPDARGVTGDVLGMDAKVYKCRWCGGFHGS
jgi:hypothetical protein